MPAQVLQMRAGGFLGPEQRELAEDAETNRYVPEGCTCGDQAWSVNCAVHGR
jgi:hypothetical protein